MLVIRGNYGQELSKEQLAALAEIDRRLSAMSPGGSDFEPELWEEAALTSDRLWADLRCAAGAALAAFEWPLESPPSDPRARGVTYVKAARDDED